VPITFENNQIYADRRYQRRAARPASCSTPVPGAASSMRRWRAKWLSPSMAKRKARARGAGTYTIKFRRQTRVYSIGSEKLSVPRSYVIDFSGERTLLGRPIAGVLGYEFFQRYVVVIDVDAHTMTMSDPADAKARRPLASDQVRASSSADQRAADARGQTRNRPATISSIPVRVTRSPTMPSPQTPNASKSSLVSVWVRNFAARSDARARSRSARRS